MASKSREQDVDDERRGLIPALFHTIKNAILAPIRPFVSRTALKAYLTTILIVCTAFVLLGFAIFAYIFFYWSYIPRIGFERSIHLQFDNVYTLHDKLRQNAHPYPYGSATLGTDMVSSQGYDVWIELAMPRTGDNQEAGNFMLEVNMYAPQEKGAGTPTSGNIFPLLKSDASTPSDSMDPPLVLATSRRPAILPYRSYWVDMFHKALELPWYILGFRSEQSTLIVPMFEQLSFDRGFPNIPSTIRLEIQSTHRLQIYFARVLFRARFRGLRWLMYNHRIISAFICISSFWVTEVFFAAVAWSALALALSRGKQEIAEVKAEEVQEVADRVKKEEEDEDTKVALSDTERTFPTLRGQQPLRYTSPTPEIKREPDESTVMIPETVAKAHDADDEDEDVDFFDSGIGTSLESSGPARRESMRRRRGRPETTSRSPASIWREEDEEQ